MNQEHLLQPIGHLKLSTFLKAFLYVRNKFLAIISGPVGVVEFEGDCRQVMCIAIIIDDRFKGLLGRRVKIYRIIVCIPKMLPTCSRVDQAFDTMLIHGFK